MNVDQQILDMATNIIWTLDNRIIKDATLLKTEKIFILLPSFTFFIFCPDILGGERYSQYASTNCWYLEWPSKNDILIINVGLTVFQ